MYGIQFGAHAICDTRLSSKSSRQTNVQVTGQFQHQNSPWQSWYQARPWTP